MTARHETSHFSEASELAPGAIPPGSKWPRRKAEHLPPSIIVVLKAWSYISSTHRLS